MIMVMKKYIINFAKKHLSFASPITTFYYALRAIIRLGIWRYIKIKSRNSAPPHDCPHFLTIIACAKDEGANIIEWIEFHRIIGVDKFIIYNNNGTDNTHDIIAPYIKSGLVEYIDWPGAGQQMPIYVDGLLRVEQNTKWAAFIDLDEFIMPVKFDNLSDYMNSLPVRTAQVYLGWANFGANGHDVRPDGLVLENYTKSIPLSTVGKTIVNPRAVIGLCNPHVFIVNGKTVDADGKLFGMFDWHGKISVKSSRGLPLGTIRCNHYQTKSRAEFLSKLHRGNASTGNRDRAVRKFSEQRFNDICARATSDDGHALRFIPELKKRIK